MTWLFPFFLAAGAAIIAPIVLHLRRQPPSRRVEFGSLMFLQASPVVTSTRRRFERWLLLLLRCLVLLLIAAMFARPFFSRLEEAPAGKGMAVVLLVDRSASMSRGKLWAEAKAKAQAWAQRLGPQDHLALGTVDRVLTRLVDFEETKALSAAERAALVSDELDRIGCGEGATHLDTALREAVSWAAEAGQSEGPAQRRLVLISDLQEGSRLEGLRGFAWPEDITLLCESVKAADHDNLSLSLAAAEEEDQTLSAASPTKPTTTASPMLRVRLANARESSKEAYSLAWQGSEANSVASGQLPAGAARVLRVPQSAAVQPQQVLLLKGDAWDFDNRLYLSPAQPRSISVVCLAERSGLSDAASPIYYLARALQPSPQAVPRLRVLDATATSSEAIQAAQWLIVLPEKIKPEALQAASQWIEQGGLALCPISKNYSPATLKTLLGSELGLTEATVKNYALLTDLDWRHALLRPFEDARLRDLAKIHIWQHRRLVGEAAKALPAGAEVLARFDNGEPAWLSLPRGKGRVVLMLHGWQPAESQLALSSKFVPLIFGMIAGTGEGFESSTQLLVGDALPLPREGAVTITAPNGKQRTISATAAGAERMVLAEHAGVYTLQSGSTSHRCAVNLTPAESRVEPLALNRLTELGVKLADETQGTAEQVIRDKQRLADEALESRQQYWLIALALLLWVLGLETWVAGQRAAEVKS